VWWNQGERVPAHAAASSTAKGASALESKSAFAFKSSHEIVIAIRWLTSGAVGTRRRSRHRHKGIGSESMFSETQSPSHGSASLAVSSISTRAPGGVGRRTWIAERDGRLGDRRCRSGLPHPESSRRNRSRRPLGGIRPPERHAPPPHHRSPDVLAAWRQLGGDIVCLCTVSPMRRGCRGVGILMGSACAAEKKMVWPGGADAAAAGRTEAALSTKKKQRPGKRISKHVVISVSP